MLILVAGVALGVALTLSPLTLLVLGASAALLQRVTRTLPPDERWWLIRLCVLAIALRVAAIGVLFLVSNHDSQGAGYLFGDEAYALSRSWRFRNVLLGFPQLKYDYMIAFEGYGQSSYISMMTYLQMLAGPAPYGLRVLNAVVYMSAVLVLFRMTRRAFGAFTAFSGTVVLLFLPTLFFWSISLLKESFYFVLTVAALAAVAEAVHATTWSRRALAAAVLLASLFGLQGLRNGAVALALTGIGAGLAAAYVVGQRTRVVLTSAAAVVAVIACLVVPALQQRLLAAVEQAAVTHTGHVFTVGHGYKLLDENYYIEPGNPTTYDLTAAEASRYVIRAAVSYFTVPLPWQITTRGELAYLPEQLLWYVMLALAPIGAFVAIQRDRIVAMLLIASVLPTALVVAMTTGNVGTLIRHRTLVVPYLIWISAMGLPWMMRRLTGAKAAA